MLDQRESATEFLSARLRGMITVGLLGVGALVGLLGAALQIMLLELLGRIEAGDAWAVEEATALEVNVGLAAFAQVALAVITAVAFMMWQYRSVRNLPALGIANCRYTPGWSVGWWFIPVMNLIAPPQVMGDLWRASTPGAGADDWKGAGFPALVGWWWGFFILAHFSGIVANYLSRGELAEIGELQRLTVASLVYEVAWLASGLLALLMVRRIYVLQDLKAAGQ